MRGGTGMGQEKSMRGGGEDPILRPRPAPPHCHPYKRVSMCPHAPPEGPVITNVISRAHTCRHRLLWAHTRRLSLTCLHVATRADTRPQHDDVIIHYDLTRLPRPTRFDPFIRTRSKPPRKKKGLTKLNLNFDQKVKIFKMGLSLSVFWVHSNFGIHFLI